MKHSLTENVISNSLERGLDALDLLAEHGEVRLADLAEELEVSRATAFRVLASLQSRGYVEHARAERVYRLGHAVRALAERSDTSSVLRLAAPAMAELRASTGETVNLALLRRGTIVYAAIFDGVHALRMQASVGAVVPAHATAIGKAILAALPPDRREALLPPEPYPAHTANTITTRRELTRELTSVRSRGYAVDNQEEEIGAACLAAPILGSDGQAARRDLRFRPGRAPARAGPPGTRRPGRPVVRRHLGAARLPAAQPVRPGGGHGGMTYQFQRSMAQFERASQSLAGGVATAFRSAQQPVPVSFTTGRGSRLTDVDGNEYVDYALGFGPMLLGHSPEPVLEAVRRQLDRGLGFGASHELEAELAEAVCRTVPSAELCVFGSTGSEAVHSAIRIARAATGRNRVIKFLGHYHGWLDPVHVGVPGQTGKAPATGGQDPGGLGLGDRVPVERRGCAVGRARRRRRRGHHGARCDQRRRVPADSRLPRARQGADRTGRRRADLRRGHHRLPARARRRPAALWRAA